MNILLIGLALVTGFIGGYVTCFFWGKSRHAIVEVVEKAAEATTEAAEKVKEQ